jgi:ribonuclease Z
MPRLIFLGTSNAIPDERHENTHMLLVGSQRVVLIDCVDSPIVRLKKAGVEPDQLSDVVLTHFHPDHVAGIPQLLMNLWLMGRRRTLDLYGLDYTLDRIKEMMGLYDWSKWPSLFPVIFHRLPEHPMVPVLESEEFRILAAPVQHLIPTIGLRIEFTKSRKVLAYSCDTEPCPQVVRLADGADILVHEASGALTGHSSAAQAGQMAAEAESGSLYLIHYPTGQYFNPNLVTEARSQYGGPIMLAEDFMTILFD